MKTKTRPVAVIPEKIFHTTRTDGTRIFIYNSYNSGNVLDYHCDESISLTMYDKGTETFNQFRQRMYYEAFNGMTCTELNQCYYHEKQKMKDINSQYCGKVNQLFDLLNECCSWVRMPLPPDKNITFTNVRWIRKDGNSQWFVGETADHYYECHWGGS